MTVSPIKKIKNGDLDIAEQVVSENYDAIYKYCYWKVGNSADAQDITQEVFLSFVKNIDTYTDRGKPRAFLYTIAKNLCINWSKKIKPDYIESTKESIDSYATEKIESMVDKIELEEIINQLPEEQKEVIVLRYGHDLKVNEIAVIIGKSRFTVRYRINLALATIKNKLKGSDYH
ncbi:RNA polymerase sigma factor [Clostridium nigeriense]|uniref:RNA polymerase sigma factor n=1 Tax=Clostridium nigeriense TaxID=1805470 RepID=UPI003D341479